MSATVNEAVIEVIRATDDYGRTWQYGVIVVVLLMVLLTLRELMNAENDHAGLEWAQISSIAVLPLMVAAGMVIGLRLLHFLQVL